MNKKEIIILGKGEHAKVLIDIIEEEGIYTIIGIIDPNVLKEESFKGYPILGDDDILEKLYENGVKNAAIGVGAYKNNIHRTNVFNFAKNIGFNIPSHCHPKSYLSRSVVIGEGTVVFPGVNLNTDVHIGINNIIATGAIVDHGTKTGNHVLISSGVVIGGEVNIENGVLCALGSKIISGINIKSNITIAAGAVVVKDLIEVGVYFGCPAVKK